MLIHRLFSLEDRRFFCGPRPALLAAAMLRRSLFARPCAAFGGWVWPAATAAQRWAAHPIFFFWRYSSAVNFRRGATYRQPSCRRRSRRRLRDGKGGGEAADPAGKARAGPSRPASPDTARPARRAGQPQNKRTKKALIKLVF